MLELAVIPFLLQVAIPLGLIFWLGRGRHASLAAHVALILAAGGWLLAVAMAGLWLVLPLPLLGGLVVLFVAALARSIRRSQSRATWPRGARELAGSTVRAAVATAGLVLAASAGTGHAPPGPAFDLAMPLRDGTYLVANGGSVPLVNAHVMTLEGERFQSYRGQSYGLDLVRMGVLGLRAPALLPSDPSRYAIFGDTVVAPCAGAAVMAVDGLPDLPPPTADRRNLAGNHVILACDSVWVVLAHFRQRSVAVAPAASVSRGDLLGVVGNSGNTSEPHLHLHAQTPGTMAAPLGGDPIPIRINGNFPVRNELLRAAPALSTDRRH